MSSSIEIKINDRVLNVAQESTIIEIADQMGIYIPRFCYHKKLSIDASCRMCLVEVEGVPKPLPACATPIKPDMQIWTRSDKTKAAQRAVMEFLLINHPLDCPICDQGGQCELQDLAMQYGRKGSVFEEAKRTVPNDDLGPLIGTEMTRCIHCTRCIRFGAEIAGEVELGATGRGEAMQITTHIQRHLKSELSGNMIDVCPVGALTSKPFQAKARPWELRRATTIAPHDCVGSHVNVHIYNQKVVRVVPKEIPSLNDSWLSDRDRYAYLGLESPQRLKQPMIKIGDGWQTTDWPTALGQAARCLKITLQQHGSTQLGGLIAPNATVEELFLFQQLCRHLDSPHIDHRLREIDTRDQAVLPIMPITNLAIEDLENCDLIVLIGSNIKREQPVLTPRLRQAVAKGAAIISLNCVDCETNFKVTHTVVVPPDQLLMQIATLAQHCGARLSESGIMVDHNPKWVSIAQQLQSANKIALLVGSMIHHHPQAAHLRYWIRQLALVNQATEIHLTDGPNSAGAWLAGAIPHREAKGRHLTQSAIGLSAHEMLEQSLKAYLLFNVEPPLDCADAYQAQKSMEQAECVIAFTGFKSPNLLASADVLLPVVCFAENEGTFINVEGRVQSFKQVVPPAHQVRLGWEVLQSMSKMMQISEMNYPSIDSVRQAIGLHDLDIATSQSLQTHSFNDEPNLIPMPSVNDHHDLVRITEWPLYSVDPLVRYAEVLQQAGSCEPTAVYVHSLVAEQMNLTIGESVLLRQGQAKSQSMPVVVDDRIPPGCVWTPAARQETATLGPSFGIVRIIRAQHNE